MKLFSSNGVTLPKFISLRVLNKTIFSVSQFISTETARSETEDNKETGLCNILPSIYDIMAFDSVKNGSLYFLTEKKLRNMFCRTIINSLQSFQSSTVVLR